MPTLENYKKRLQNKNKVIKEQRRQAAELNNELAWELADGHQEATVLTRSKIDGNLEQWEDMDILVRHALTGQEKKIITKPHINLPIGSYVRYNDITCIIRENLLDPQDVMPSYKAYICTTMLHLKGCPFSFPVYAFNSSYSSKGIVDYDKVLGVDSRNKLYLQKNKYTIRLYENHRNYRIVIGDEETKYNYFITEMDDISYPGMFVVSLKVDEIHPNDSGYFAFNENEIDFSDLVNYPENEEEPVEEYLIVTCGNYYKVGDTIEIKCNKEIAVCEVNDYDMVELAMKDDKSYTAICKKPGVLLFRVQDTQNNEVFKNVIVK